MDKKKILTDLYNFGCFKFGEFKLKSGIKSPFYINFRNLINEPEYLRNVCKFIYPELDNINPNLEYYIAGLPYAGIPYANAISLEKNIPQLLIRKEQKKYGLGNIVDGVRDDDLRNNIMINIVLIEDIMVTGSSILDGINKLKQSEINFNIIKIISIVDREQGGLEKIKTLGYNVESIFKISEIFDILESNDQLVLNREKINLSRKFVLERQHQLNLLNREIIKLEDRKELGNNSIFKRIIDIMFEKKSNLCVALDFNKVKDIIEMIEKLGKHVVVFKLHIDLIDDFSEEFIKKLITLKTQYNFVIFEDRKFSDIGNIFKQQFTGGIYKIKNWADLITVHLISGSNMLEVFKNSRNSNQGVLLVSQMSSEDNLIDKNYTQKNVEIAEKYKELVCGFISKEKLYNNSFLYFRPGISIESKTDTYNQVYHNPHQAIQQGIDIIVVGRSITRSSNIEEETIRYKSIGWNSYLMKVNM